MNERLQALAESFFSRITDMCRCPKQVDFVVVTHLLEDRPWFLSALERLGRVAAVIPKRKSMIPRIRNLLRHKYNLLEIPRSSLRTLESIREQLKGLHTDRPVCVLDIGGYFAAAARGIADFEIAGIVEDTENGHVKYQQAIEGADAHVPIASVARSDLKRPENFLIGQSLVYSVEAILRDLDELLHGRTACVLGYGNIGRSVAQHLQERHVDVVVYDSDPMKLVEAFTHGFRTANDSVEAVGQVDVVFCVTGRQSIGMQELEAMQPRAYVATVTSPDDEFLPEVMDLHVSHRPKHISEYRRRDGHIIYLMNRGQAVNFVHGSVVGPFIQLLQAEILVTASALISGTSTTHGIYVIEREQQSEIAREWLKVYRH